MGQAGFFDLQHRYEGLDAKSDPLVAILAAVPFELFRGKLKTALVKGGLRRSDGTRKSATDSQKLEDVLDPGNTASGVWADSAYRSKEVEERLAEQGLKSHIHRRGSRGKPLDPRQEAANKTRSKVRARVEHVFGCQHSMGGKFVHTIGILRVTTKIGMQNLFTTCAVWSCSKGRQSSLPEAKGQKDRMHQPKIGWRKSKK